MEKALANTKSSGDPYLDNLVAQIDAGRLTIEQAVRQYALSLAVDETTAAQIVALALGAEQECYADELGPILPPKAA